MRRKNKRAELMNQLILQIILVALIFVLFVMATADKVNSRGVKQQVLEKQLALLIDSAVQGMSFSVDKLNVNGVINKVEVKGSKVHVVVEGLASIKGHPYFTPYSVRVREDLDKFVVIIDE